MALKSIWRYNDCSFRIISRRWGTRSGRFLLIKSVRTLPFFKPPFHGLLWLCWLYFALCFVVHPQSPIMHGRFIDPDDTLYAVQSAELLDGQGWYDHIEHRMDPPCGRGYSLLAFDAASLCGDNRRACAVCSVAPTPYSLRRHYGRHYFFWACFSPSGGRRGCFMPKSWIGLTAFVIILMQGVVFDFMPGHIDHHGFEALLCQPVPWLQPVDDCQSA